MSFSEKLKFSLRKLAISLKRNYFIIPMIVIGVTILVIMCSLYTESSVITRAAGNKESAIAPYSAIFEFGACLLTILGGVAYINYAFTGYGKKRPVYMMIIFLVLFAASVALLFLIYFGIKPSIDDDIVKYNQYVADGSDLAKINEYSAFVKDGTNTLSLIMSHIVLCLISIVLVITAPFVQAGLKNIKFKSISSVGSTTSDAVEVEEEVK